MSKSNNNELDEEEINNRKLKILKRLEEWSKLDNNESYSDRLKEYFKVPEPKEKIKIRICMWERCKKHFSKYVLDRVMNDFKYLSLDWLDVGQCACLWQCSTAVNWVFNKKIVTNLYPILAAKLLTDEYLRNKGAIN